MENKKRKLIYTVVGNSPECPICGHWNALLDEWFRDGERYGRNFKCRDCGYTINKADTTVVIKAHDKPGMGIKTTYHEVKRMNGEDF